MAMHKETWRAIKFTLFSVSAGVIQAVSFSLFNELCRAPYWLAYLVSLVLSVLWNFTLNRRYTFKSATNVPIAMAKVAGFYVIFTPLSTWLGQLAERAGTNDYVVFVVTILSNFVLEFLFCKFVVYRHREDTL